MLKQEATAAFIRKVVDFAGIDKEQSEKFIEQENGIYYYYLEHFSEFFAEYWYGMPSEFAITADSAYTLAYTKFLADQIGLIPRKAIVTDDPPQKFRKEIEDAFHNISEGVDVQVEFEEDGYLIEKSINLANDKGALFFEITPPSSETLIINRSFVGYKGALNLLEKIYSASVGGK